MATDYEFLRDSALKNLTQYMDSLDPEKGKKLAYWINDYTNFLRQENSFQSNKLIRYKRGAIIKVHLGYRVGSEEGGLHYAIVMDRYNTIHSSTLTVIPLTSVKPGTNVGRLSPYQIPLGDEVYTLLRSNFNAELKSAKQHMKEITELLTNLTNPKDSDTLNARLKEVEQQIKYCKKMQKEADRMKQGSIALVGQMITVSKIRIYDPKYSKDALSKVRISANTLDILDAKVQDLYGHPKVEEE